MLCLIAYGNVFYNEDALAALSQQIAEYLQ
jgi:hypothetical protein